MMTLSGARGSPKLALSGVLLSEGRSSHIRLPGMVVSLRMTNGWIRQTEAGLSGFLGQRGKREGDLPC